MPKLAADKTSAIMAMRLRSRPVICKIGSTPAFLSAMQRPRLDAFSDADCMSVTFTAWTFRGKQFAGFQLLSVKS